MLQVDVVFVSSRSDVLCLCSWMIMLFNMPPYQISILYTTKYVSLIYILLSSIYYFKATFRFVFTKSHKLFPSLKILLRMEKHTRYNAQKDIQSAWYLSVCCFFSIQNIFIFRPCYKIDIILLCIQTFSYGL